MDIYTGSQVNNPHDYAERIENIYPDSYKRMYPHVQHMVNSLSDESMYNMTNENMDKLAEETVARSGMMNDPQPGHDRGIMNDIAKILIARELFDRHRGRRFFPFAPFVFLPLAERGGFRDGFRGGFRDFDRDGFRDGFRDRDFDRDRFHDFDRDRDFDRDHDRDFDRHHDFDHDRDGHRDRDGYRYWY